MWASQCPKNRQKPPNPAAVHHRNVQRRTKFRHNLTFDGLSNAAKISLIRALEVVNRQSDHRKLGPESRVVSHANHFGALDEVRVRDQVRLGASRVDEGKSWASGSEPWTREVGFHPLLHASTSYFCHFMLAWSTCRCLVPEYGHAGQHGDHDAATRVGCWWDGKLSNEQSKPKSRREETRKNLVPKKKHKKSRRVGSHLVHAQHGFVRAQPT